MLNIVVFHHFDYPEGMATTKRFQLFADYFHGHGCQVTFVLKTNQVSNNIVEAGTHKGIIFYKVFMKRYKKYPFHYDERQYTTLIEIISKIFDHNHRNVILTGGITPEFLLVIRKLLPKWELYCDYLEDQTTLRTIYKDLKQLNLFRYIKSQIASTIYSPLISFSESYMFKNASGISAISPHLFLKAKKKVTECY